MVTYWDSLVNLKWQATTDNVAMYVKVRTIPSHAWCDWLKPWQCQKRFRLSQLTQYLIQFIYAFMVYLTTFLVTWNYPIAYSDGKIGEWLERNWSQPHWVIERAGSSSNAPGLCSGDIRFESRLGHGLCSGTYRVCTHSRWTWQNDPPLGHDRLLPNSTAILGCRPE